MPARASITADSLTKRYGDTEAVTDLDLRIPSGTVYGFLGPNGSGKTTTIQMFTTMLTPTSGTAWIAGHSIEDRDAVTSHIGYMPETPPVYDELSGREQLEYAAMLHGMSEQRADDRIETFLNRLGLAGDTNKRIESYSKGMKRKIALGQAILHDPDVVFLDEPTSGLDPRAARTVKDVISELTARDTTVFLSTHILSVVDGLADTVGVLHGGKLVAEGTPDGLKERAEGGTGTLEDVFMEVTDVENSGDDDRIRRTLT